MTTDALRSMISDAMLAPSVHNVQPARWRIVADDVVELFEDTCTRLTVGDPRGNDAGISLGAASEGLRLAASARGMSVKAQERPAQYADTLAPVARYRLAAGSADVEALAGQVSGRSSWRGKFAPVTRADRDAALKLAGSDSAVVVDPGALADVAKAFDRASYGFMRNDGFRRELKSWMRFSPSHPRWDRDGLNADAMALSRFEAAGASIVLGPAFKALDTVGVAAPLLAEGSKVASATGVVVFHRPAAEAPFDSGAHFYRLWLTIEAAGFGAAVLAALADDPVSARHIARIANVPEGRRIVSAFRIGRRPDGAKLSRARRGLEEVLV